MHIVGTSSHWGVIRPLCDMLTAQVLKLVTEVLKCLNNILKVAALPGLISCCQPYVLEVDEVNGKYI